MHREHLCASVVSYGFFCNKRRSLHEEVVGSDLLVLKIA